MSYFKEKWGLNNSLELSIITTEEGDAHEVSFTVWLWFISFKVPLSNQMHPESEWNACMIHQMGKKLNS